jgi:hypothetical protein
MNEGMKLRDVRISSGVLFLVLQQIVWYFDIGRRKQ